MSKTFQLDDNLHDKLLYGLNLVYTADQYMDILFNTKVFSKVSKFRLLKFCNNIIDDMINGEFLYKCIDIQIKNMSTFENYKFIQDRIIEEIC